MILSEFLNGNSFDAYRFFGAHFEENGAVFRVYAPKAARVTLEGDFTGWQEWDAAYSDRGIWTFLVPHAQHGQNYKYCVYSRRGKRVEHADPYGYGMGGYGCSVLRNIPSYSFSDGLWMERRSLNFDRPMLIYELHLASWKRDYGQYPTYDGIADELIGYLKQHHYTHVEFLPLNEHPLDASWGYQSTGFFSPTARFGEAWQLMYLIDRLHQAGIGAILDFVSVHFAVDHYGLRSFDGAGLYESSKTANRRSDWGSFFFEHTRGEVRSFLKSAANYWLSEYHFDGLRFDAVSRLIYGHGEPQYGENPGGLAFLREINDGLERLHPTAMRIAEDSTAYPGVTRSVHEGGLGFHYKWAMGWVYDTMDFFRTPPAQRPEKTARLTMALGYFDAERFLLPLSHDLMGGSGKAPLTAMPGREKLRQMKLLYLFLAAHPGKKLLFLGSELGTFTPWQATRGIDRSPMYDPAHAGFRAFCMELNRLCLEHPALYEADFAPWGAQWVSCNDNGNGVFALLRHSSGRHLLMVMNTASERRVHTFPLPNIRGAELLLCTEWESFGGSGTGHDVPVQAENGWVTVRLSKYCAFLAEIWF